jgi:hypothetical protein
VRIECINPLEISRKVCWRKSYLNVWSPGTDQIRTMGHIVGTRYGPSPSHQRSLGTYVDPVLFNLLYSRLCSSSGLLVLVLHSSHMAPNFGITNIHYYRSSHTTWYAVGSDHDNRYQLLSVFVYHAIHRDLRSRHHVGCSCKFGVDLVFGCTCNIRRYRM